MAMVRSALGRVSRRLSGSSSPPVMLLRRRGPEIHHHHAGAAAAAAATLHPPPRGAMDAAAAHQTMRRTFMSVATTKDAAAAARVIPNLQGQQHFSKGTQQGMKWAELKIRRLFLSMDRNASRAKLVESARLNRLRAEIRTRDANDDDGDGN